MARIPFQKPKSIQWEIRSDRYGRLVAEPFEKGYALTVGHSLRRTLLAIVPGSAVAWVRIPGVKDAETRIPEVQEDTTDVLLNIKKLAVNVPSGEPAETRLEAKGAKTVTGADVSEATGIEVLNPEIHIATLGAGGSLSMDLGIGVGRGYVAADRHPAGTVPAGAIPLDAAFSPIQRVSYSVENARLGKVTDYLIEYGYERRFRQAVLVNLLRNAVQAAPQGPPPQALAALENGSLVFTIRDFGPGLPEGQEERIFDPFFTTRTTGTGLGLPVARRIVEMHGGHLHATNAPGGGALFRIELPRREG